MKETLLIKYFYLVCLIISSIPEVKSETPSAPTYQVPLTPEENRQRTESIRFMQGSIENHLVSFCVSDGGQRDQCQRDYNQSKNHSATCRPYEYKNDEELASYINQRSWEISDRKRVIENFRNHRDFLLFMQQRGKLPPSIDPQALGQKFSDLDQEITRRQQCLFQQEINAELRKITSDPELAERRQLLLKLRDISTCLTNRRPDQSLFPNFSNFFDGIFSMFNQKLDSNGKLTSDECQVLQRVYSTWSSFYDETNGNQSGSEIPTYNVNAHNSAFPYWLEAIERDPGFPREGIPLLHADTHTDLSHVHMYPSDRRFRQIPFVEFSSILRHLMNNSPEVRTERGVERIKQEMVSMVREIQQRINRERSTTRDRRRTYSEVSDSFVRDLERWINSPSTTVDDMRTTFLQASRRSIHDIAQPITGAVAAGITSDVLMVLPPWSKRIARTDSVDLPRDPYQVDLAHRVDSQEGRVIQNTNQDADSTGPSTPLLPKQNDDIPIRSYNLQAINLTNPKGTGAPPLRGFQHYLPSSTAESGFILDIDLDAFVSNGRRGDFIEPLSWGREHSISGHDTTNEGDLRAGLAAQEMELIKMRINSFFRRLQEAKEAGMCPAIITIADSTQLTRAIRGEDDDFTGGNFTPACLAFLVNYMVRKKIEEIYGPDSGC